MGTVKKILDIKNWSKKTKQITGALIALVIVAFVFAANKPGQQQFEKYVSEDMQKLIEKDEGRERKRVTKTYNSLFVISYCSFSSSGANERKEAYVGFMGKVYEANKGVAKVTGQMVNYTYKMLGCGNSILHGAKLTIFLPVLTIIFGVFLGFFLALGKMSKKKLLQKICSFYIFFFRGTPLLIQLFVVYFTIPGIFKFSWKGIFENQNEAVYKGAFLAALIAFALNAAAYCAEIIRAALQSIDKGQNEAAKALGMNYAQTMTKIIIPQSIRRMIPPLSNEFITILKDVSLVFAISLMDITTISKTVMTSEGSYLVFVPALIIYLIITAIFTAIFNAIEKRFSIYE